MLEIFNKLKTLSQLTFTFTETQEYSFFRISLYAVAKFLDDRETIPIDPEIVQIDL